MRQGSLHLHLCRITERLHQPLLRKEGELVPVSWEEAITASAEKIKAAGSNLVTLTSGRLTNEDLYAAKTFAGVTNSKVIHYSNMGGGEWVTRVGLTTGSNLSDLGKGSVILVIGSDLHQEAPLWWLRIKQAAEHGATLIVANARKTRLDKFAAFKRRYEYGEEIETVRSLFTNDKETAELLTKDENLVIFYGSDGMGLAQTAALAEACAEQLVKTSHFGRTNNGLVAVWQHANDQGAAELGILPDADLVNTINSAMGLYLVGVDPVGDDPLLKDAVQRAGFVIVQELFLTETAKLADVVFPAQVAVERSGSYVSGERRAQYFGAAIPALPGTRSDHAIISAVLQGIGQPSLPASVIMKYLPWHSQPLSFKVMRDQRAGTCHWRYGCLLRWYRLQKHFWFGYPLPLVISQQVPSHTALPAKPGLKNGELLAVPVTSLYDHGQLMDHTPLLEKRVVSEGISIHPATALKFDITDGQTLKIKLNGDELSAVVKINTDQPEGVLLIARSCGIPSTTPVGVEIVAPEPAKEGGAL